MDALCECPEGERIGGYNEKHDARFCKRCLKWIEPVCGGAHCEFCKDRPLVPWDDEVKPPSETPT